MQTKMPWYWRLDVNPVVVTISTLAALVTIVSYQWPPSEPWKSGGPPLQLADETAAPSRAQPPTVALPSGSVRMALPHDGQTVEQFTNAEFNLDGQVPPGHKPVLYVRDPLGQYWSFGPITPGTPASVQIGTREDRGRLFEVGVWITSKVMPRGGPYQSPPPNVGNAAITVTRL